MLRLLEEHELNFEKATRADPERIVYADLADTRRYSSRTILRQAKTLKGRRSFP